MSKKRNNSNYKQSSSKAPNAGNSESASMDNEKYNNSRNGSNDNRSRTGRTNRKGAYTSKTNDVSWYNKNPELTRDVGSLFFSEPVGSVWDVPNAFQPSIPGVMAFDVAVTAGYSPDGTSPINAAAADHYSWMRSNNTGSNVYDAPDQMMYFLAMDSIYTMWMFAARTYGIARDFTYANRYYPKALIASGGWDANDVWSNMSRFRAYLENYACLLATMKVPSHFDIYKRHSWLFSGLYVDSPSVKAQTYIFNPDGFYKYGLDQDTSAGRLQYIRKWEAGWDGTVDGFFQLMDSLIDPVLNSQDMRTMSGDIIKLYGDNTFVLPKLDENFKVLPSFDPNVLLQIHNATICGKVMYNDVWQDVADLSAGYSSLRCTPRVFRAYAGNDTVPKAFEDLKMFIDLPVDNPSPELIMEATRLAVGMERQYDTDDNPTSIWNITEVGSDFITEVSLWFMELDDNHTAVMRCTSNQSGYNLLYGSEVNSDWYASGSYGQGALISQFNWHPLFYITNDAPVDSDLRISFLMEMTNYAFIDKSVLWRLHNAAMLSLYNVPHGR